MKDWQSQAHVKWECLYHVVIVPKYRRKVFFGKRRKEVGEMLRQLCRWSAPRKLVHVEWESHDGREGQGDSTDGKT